VKIKPLDVAQSSLLLSPDPLVSNDHDDDFKFETAEANQAFVNAVMTWVASEFGGGADVAPATGGAELPAGGGEVPTSDGAATDPEPGATTTGG